jgi:hypothetical protein
VTVHVVLEANPVSVKTTLWTLPAEPSGGRAIRRRTANPADQSPVVAILSRVQPDRRVLLDRESGLSSSARLTPMVVSLPRSMDGCLTSEMFLRVDGRE